MICTSKTTKPGLCCKETTGKGTIVRIQGFTGVFAYGARRIVATQVMRFLETTFQASINLYELANELGDDLRLAHYLPLEVCFAGANLFGTESPLTILLQLFHTFLKVDGSFLHF